MHLAIEIALLLIGFFFLAKGADWLVTGSTVIADRIGVRPLIVGLTVVAWGTSAPEVVVSGLAAVEGNPGLSMGNVLGSNVANIGLVLGLCALILPKVLHNAPGKREASWLLLSLGLFWWVALDLEITRLDGVLLLSAVVFYNLLLLWEARQQSIGVAAEEPPTDTWLQRHPKLATALGALAIAAAAKAILMGATGIEFPGLIETVGVAYRAGLSDRVVGLTVVAVGTSLPELAAGVSGALKGHADISLGNVVGSNVFNVLGVIGIVALIHPFGGTAEPEVQEAIRHNLHVDFPMVAVFSVAAILLPMQGGEANGRLKGALLLLGYFVYSGYLVLPWRDWV